MTAIANHHPPGKAIVTAAAVIVMTVASAPGQRPVPPADEFAHDVLHFRGDVPFISYQSLAAGDGTAVVIADRAYAISGPDDPSMEGVVDGIDGPIAALGDLLLESETDKVLVHRRVSETAVERVGEFSITTTQCRNPMQPHYLGSYGAAAIYEFTGVDCPATFPRWAEAIVNVDLTDPASPVLGRLDAGGGDSRTRTTAQAMHDGIVARARLTTGLGGSFGSSGVGLYDVRLSPPQVAGSWSPDEPFVAQHVMIAKSHLYVAGDRYGSSRYYVVDISNLGEPRLVGSLTDQPWFSDESDGFGYGSSGEGLIMLDLSVPDAPRVVDSVDLVGRTVALLADGTWVHAITRTEGRLWYQTVQRIDGRWSVPEDPVALPGPSGWSGPPDVSGAQIAFPAGSDGLHMFGGEPAPSCARTIGVDADHVALEGSLATIARDNEVVVIDVNADDRNEPVLRRFPLDSVLDVDTDAGLMAALGATELLTLDLGEATDGPAGRMPVRAARAMAMTAPFVVVLESGGDEQLDLRIVDASEPSLPRVASVVGVPTDTHGIAAFGSNVYVVGSTVRTLDLSVPTRPEWVSEPATVGTILPRQVTAEHGYLMLTLSEGFSQQEMPVAVLDMSRKPPAVVQRVDYPADVHSDDNTLVRVSDWQLPQVYDIRPRPVARLALEARCGTTIQETVGIHGSTRPDAITVTLSAGAGVLDTSLSTAGAFTLTGALVPGVTELSVQGTSDRGPGEIDSLILSVRPELPLDPWATFARSGGELSRPMDESGCVSFGPRWSLVIPTRRFTLDTQARAGALVTVTLGGETTALSEVVPGHFRGEVDVPDVPQAGMRVRFGVNGGGSRDTIEGAALTFRAYVPRAANGWRSREE